MLFGSPRTTSQSTTAGIDEFNRAFDWISQHLGRRLHGRFDEYRRKLDRLYRLASQNQIESLTDASTQAQILNAMFEGESQIQVWKAFQTEGPPPQFAQKVNEIISGPSFVKDERILGQADSRLIRRTKARNTLFEFLLFAFLKNRGNPSRIWKSDRLGI
jgi:hypothetical protein